MPAPRSAGPCSSIRDAGVVTRHGPRATYPAAPVLAETVPSAPTAARALATSTVTGLSPPVNPSCSPDSGRSTFRGASTYAVLLRTPAGRKPKTP